MANEIRYPARKGESGLTLYAAIENTDGASADCGKYWNGAAWEAKAAANWATYAVTLTESAANRQFVGTMPAVGCGVVTVHVHERETGAALISDPELASQVYQWSGAALLSAAKMAELALAVIAGVASYDATTGVATYKRADGTTTSVVITYTGSGDRTAAVIS